MTDALLPVAKAFYFTLDPIMATRNWLSIIGPPILGGAVYAELTLSSRSPAIVPANSSIASLVLWGTMVCLIFEFAVVLPLSLVLHPHRWARSITFLVLATAAWFAISILFMLFLGAAASAALANALAIFLPGAVLVVAFWLLMALRGA